MIGTLTPEEVEQVLSRQALGRLGCTTEGRVYVVPITYAYDGRRIIGHSAPGTKTRMMRSNPEVCFEVEEVENLANWKSVIAWGRYTELQGTEAAAALGLLVDHLQPLMTGSSIPSHGLKGITPPTRAHEVGTVVFAIVLREKSGRFERSPANAGSRGSG